MRRFNTRGDAERYTREMAAKRGAVTAGKRGRVRGSGRGFMIRSVESGRYLVQGTWCDHGRGRSFGTRDTYEEAERLGYEETADITRRLES